MIPLLPQPPEYYIEHVRRLQVQIRDHVLMHLRLQEAAAISQSNVIDLAGVADTRGGDTIYRIDTHAEDVLLDFCEDWGQIAPFVLIAEGVEGAGWRVFPDGAAEEEAQFLMVVDPIDGTRNIMYNKRSAWVLTGIAPNRGRQTTLRDIQAAVMTEVPTTRHRLSDQLWAIRGGGAPQREAHDLFTGAAHPLPIRPSRATTLDHGFASVAKFFPTAKGAIAAFEEALLARVAPDEGENPLVFDDEYISTGGQLYEILVGHDRFLADLRPRFYAAAGHPTRLVCHPYDICVELIAKEAGVIVTDDTGASLSAPLDIRAPVSWIAYANAALRQRIEPELLALLDERVGRRT